MPYAKLRSWTFIVLLVGIIILAWQIQDLLFLNWDVSWLMHATRRLLAGGTYTSSFFETNPPLILFLYAPPVVISKMLGLNIIYVLRVYIFCIATISWCLCYQFSKKIFSEKDGLLASSFLLTLALIYLVLPLQEFGQRDHLMLMLTMPYLLTLVYRLQSTAVKLFPRSEVVIGLMAGLGFALKPHFLMTPLLVELYFMYSKKNLFRWLRLETITMMAVIGVYALSVFAFFPDYLSFIVPFSLRHYYAGISASWVQLLTQPLALLCCLPLLLYVSQYKTNTHRALNTVLLLALLGFLFSYLAQRTTFYYHLIPPFALTILLLVLLFSEFVEQRCRKTEDFIFAGLFGLLIFSFPLYQAGKIYDRWAEYKEKINPLIVYMQQNARQQSVYFFASTILYTFPGIDYAGVKPGSRFPFFWIVSGLVNELPKTIEAKVTQLNDKKLVIDMIADDFNKEKPELVFVDVSTRKSYISKSDFDYLKYFSGNENFNLEWKNYSYVTTLDQEGFYNLAVYKRKVRVENVSA